MMWRHGDVLIAAVHQLPVGVRRRPGAVLAYGEITGHSHRFQDADSIALWEQDGNLFVQVLTPTAMIVHEEHHPLSIPQGTYRVWMQREYTPQAIRTVID